MQIWYVDEGEGFILLLDVYETETRSRDVRTGECCRVGSVTSLEKKLQMSLLKGEQA
jgi:hypothetical protein